MSPGDIIQLRRVDGSLRVWQVQGVYLGAVNQESVVGITALDRNAADVDGKKQYELYVPVDIIEAVREKKP